MNESDGSDGSPPKSLKYLSMADSMDVRGRISHAGRALTSFQTN